LFRSSDKKRGGPTDGTQRFGEFSSDGWHGDSLTWFGSELSPAPVIAERVPGPSNRQDARARWCEPVARLRSIAGSLGVWAAYCPVGPRSNRAGTHRRRDPRQSPRMA
jgi:hypothetical protein